MKGIEGTETAKVVITSRYKYMCKRFMVINTGYKFVCNNPHTTVDRNVFFLLKLLSDFINPSDCTQIKTC